MPTTTPMPRGIRLFLSLPLLASLRQGVSASMLFCFLLLLLGMMALLGNLLPSKPASDAPRKQIPPLAATGFPASSSQTGAVGGTLTLPKTNRNKGRSLRATSRVVSCQSLHSFTAKSRGAQLDSYWICLVTSYVAISIAFCLKVAE